MTLVINSILDIVHKYDAIVFDQWGVLHNGSAPYSNAIATIQALSEKQTKLGILSNSGKRADPNAARIEAMGFDTSSFNQIMTSGEALWQNVKQGVISEHLFFPVERNTEDSAHWAKGLGIDITYDLNQAQAILLMGLPDNSVMQDYTDTINSWLSRDLPVYCSNPDRNSPRSDGQVLSPGALAFAYKDLGGHVTFYGKPHLPIFRSMESALNESSILMVGDSLEHDISGAHAAGWDSLLIEGGLYRDLFAAEPDNGTLDKLVQTQGCRAPTYRMKEVQ